MNKKPWSKETQEHVKKIVQERGSLTPAEREYFMEREGKSMRAIANLEYSMQSHR